MKIAMVLVSGALMLAPGAAQAQSASGAATNKPGRAETAKVPHASAATAGSSASNGDRANDAELRRIDRMMTICNGC